MCFQEGNQRSEQAGVVSLGSQLVCPDSGQVEEPPRATFVRKRRGQSREGERMRVVWRLALHRLRLFRLLKEANWRRS